jgi:hypothetical protein
MQPLINLNQFIAILLLLVIPAALLVAYFRKYEHSEAAHGTSAGESKKLAAPDNKDFRLEALREQVEASRMQFDASRKALEALNSSTEPEKQPENVPQPEDSVGTPQERQSDGHGHHR